MGQDGFLRPVGNRRRTARFACVGRRVANSPQVANLPHTYRLGGGANPSVSSMYVPQGSVRNATLTLVLGIWRIATSNLIPSASIFFTNCSRFFT